MGPTLLFFAIKTFSFIEEIKITVKLKGETNYEYVY